MPEGLLFLSGMLTTVVIWIIFHKPAPSRIGDPEVLRLCEKTGGHHSWSVWEDLGTDGDGWLMQVRRCENCGLANQARMIPIPVPVRAFPRQSD